MVTVGPHFVGVRADESAGLVVQLVMGLKKWLWLDEGKRMRGEVFLIGLNSRILFGWTGLDWRDLQNG